MNALREIFEVDPASNPAVSVIIPAYNEEGAVRAQVESIRETLAAAGIRHEIIVVDDGSEDRTAAEALGAGARVLQHPQNRGYGAAIKSGIRAARFDRIVISDADGTYPTHEIPALVAELESADMAVGARTGSEVHIPLIRRPAKWILGKLANHVAGMSIPDLNSGLRAFRRECLQQYFPVLSNRFSFTTTSTLALLADGYHVTYRPIDYYRRVGKSKITPTHFMDFVILVVRMAMLFNPLKVFVPLAFGCGLLGFLKVGYDIVSFAFRTGTFDWTLIYMPVLSPSAVTLLIVGLQLLLTGMLADGILRRLALNHETVPGSQSVRLLELQPTALVQETDASTASPSRAAAATQPDPPAAAQPGDTLPAIGARSGR
jgi:glycosyltransferase involved in cell wall biosynthesis